MKKRLLTLLTLALGVWAGAWADTETIFSYTVASVPSTQTDGESSFDASGTMADKCIFNIVTSGSKALFANVTISKVETPTYSLNGNDAYIKLTLAEGKTFKNGDVLSIQAVCTNSSYAERYLVINTTNSNSGDNAINTNAYSNKGGKNTLTATLTEAYDGQTVIYIKRKDGSNFIGITITRTQSDPEAPSFSLGTSENPKVLEIGTDYSLADLTGVDATFANVTSSNTSIATVGGSTITPVATGATTITFDNTADENYTATSDNVMYINVVASRTAVTLNYSPSTDYVNVGDAFTQPTLTATGEELATLKSAGAISFLSSNTSVATVDADGTIAIVAAGSATITASISGNATYSDASATYSVTAYSRAAATKWNFNVNSTKDATYLAAEVASGRTSLWIYDSNQYKSQNIGEGLTLTANGFNLGSADGLTFKFTKTDAFRYDTNNKRTWINGDTEITIPDCEQGQLVTVSFASSKNGTDRGFNLTNLSESSWSTSSTTASEFSAYVNENGDVILKATGGVYFYTIKVTDPVTITPTYDKTTYVTTKALDFTGIDGLKAYAATAATGGVVTLTEVGAVPANTPLILIGTAGTEYTVPVVASASAPAGNMLVAGTGAANNDAEYNYILFTDGLFYRIEGGSVPVGKAYLHCDSDPTGVGEARPLTIEFGDKETGINSVKASVAEGSEIYNLQGQRVAQPTKGLYIMNGKKVIIK